MAKWSMEKKKSIKPTFHCRQMAFYIDSYHRVVMTNEIKSEECHQIKVIIYAVVPVGAPSKQKPATVNLNENIIDYLHETLEDLKKRWARRIEYSVGIRCPNCSEYGDTEVIPIRDILKDQDEIASCDDGCPIYVGDILRAFSKGVTETSLGDRVPTSPRPSPSTSVSIPCQDAAAAADEVSTGSASDTESDGRLNTLAAHVPDNKYYALSNELGITYNMASSILNKHGRDYMLAMRECLSLWKNRTGGHFTELQRICYKVGVGGIWMQHMA
eukprot:XP_011670416.1 PREDICTED: uncharacterized protein LOC105441206 [Strongylocentrotus purpuratus]